ncbi:MAG: AAA family ATPase [Lachnospira sp.]|nr:AAA family ATPase [Lachnospira sp.]
MKAAYSNRELFEIAKENYQTLVFHCVKLQTEGYWTQPERMLKQTIQEQLDLYLQAVLLMFAAHNGSFDGERKHFVRAIPDHNVLELEESGDMPETSIQYANRMLTSPPILLQLFALRDKEKQTHLSVMFVDTLLNIVIAMAYLDEQKGEGVAEFLQEYACRISVFLSDELQYLKSIDKWYVYRKVDSPTFKTGYIRDEMEYVRKLVKPGVSKGGTVKAEGGEQVHGTLPIETNETKAVEQPPGIESVIEQVSRIEDTETAEQPMGIEDTETVEQASRIEDTETAEQPMGIEDAKNAEQVSEPEKTKPPVMDEEEIARQTAQARLELEQARDAKRAAAVQKLMERLDELVGLESVKTEMQSLVNLIRVRKMRANHNMPQMDMTYHMVFTGNAGTGKTTVARLVAEIYKELGVLSKGTFVETDRAGLVAGYLGQTAMKVKEVVAQAKGGVLFIDEAYSLTSREAGDDYGIEAIDTLVKEMEDNRNDLVVIVAGYRQEMERFLKSNTGLISRFNKYIDFADYSCDQLVEILNKMAQKAGMTIEESALEQVREYLNHMDNMARKDFGNARGIRNVFEKIITNQANRLVQLDNPTASQLGLITLEDVTLFTEKEVVSQPKS